MMKFLENIENEEKYGCLVIVEIQETKEIYNYSKGS